MTSTSWTARVEWARHSEISGADLEDLVEKLSGASPAIGVEYVDRLANPWLLTATITLDAATLRQATTAALQLVEQAADTKATGIEVLTTVEHDRRVDEPTFPELVGYAEIAELAGVSRQRARQLADLPDFPKAVVETHTGPLRVRAQVEAWLARWERKPGRPRTAPS